ncbi:hypothetical protein TRFO_19752 [Tritrichomonas foetus]|uniref:Uncharacterized protein n=1 Tax=Tritrichomonas foetus TaxID=1144522 RepID=A0A1J4KHL4_9EUKA|nr:hypothetical protein TRFO_19752 [Tritrichomonas foetus]|eukprot:OHT10857.1 hypothetical protein TRFO_19752 [Tritrichomonas foetus]
MNDEIKELFEELKDSKVNNQNEKITTCIHELSAKIDVSTLSCKDQDAAMFIFRDIMEQILPLTNHKNKGVFKSANDFLNHWNNLFASLSPFTFLILCHELIQKELTQYMGSFVFPFVRTIPICQKNIKTNIEYVLRILYDVNPNILPKIPRETWRILKDLLLIDDLEKLVNYFISKSINEVGAAILASKSPSKLYEKVFTEASFVFIYNFLKHINIDDIEDITTVSSRISDAMVLDGFNHDIAFDVVPLLVKENMGEMANSAFHPFWFVANRYLKENLSTSALYALFSGYKAKLVSIDQLIPFLKFEPNIEPKYRLASFHIGLVLFDCKEIQEHVVQLIQSISISRGNAMFCCLVDHLKESFHLLLEYNEDFAYQTINAILNPIPYDQYLPVYVIRLLLSLPDLTTNEKYKFNVEEIIYKYLMLSTETAAKDLQKLIHKVNMKICMSDVDWFDSPILLAIKLAEDIDPNLLSEVLSFSSLHISLIPVIINKFIQMNCKLFFNKAVSTLVNIICALGLSYKEKMQDHHYFLLEFDDKWLNDSYIEGCVNFLEVPLEPSFFGAIIKALIDYICIFKNEEGLFDRQYIKIDVANTLLVVSDLISQIFPDYALKLLQFIQYNSNKYTRTIEANALASAMIGNPIIITNYLIQTKGIEQILNSSNQNPENQSNTRNENQDTTETTKSNHTNDNEETESNNQSQTEELNKKDTNEDESTQQESNNDSQKETAPICQCESDNNTFFENIVLKAVSEDYEIAKQFAPYLKQPLNPMKTFLAFDEVEEHKSWINECKERIKGEQWIKPSNEDTKPEFTEKHFEFQKVVPEKGIEGLFDGNKTSVLSFLYFNSNSIPISIDELEEYVMKNAEDPRLIVGFFFYALNHDYHTEKVEEWTKLINFHLKQNFISLKRWKKEKEIVLYAGSLFLTSLKGFNFEELPEFLSNFILNGLKSIGYYALSKPVIAYAYRKEVSFNWYFIRSIIHLDVRCFSDIPLILAEFTDKDELADLYSRYFDSLAVQNNIDALMSILVSLTSIYFAPDDKFQTKLFPLAHNCLYSLKTVFGLPPPVKLDTQIINSLLGCLSKQKYFPSSFFTFFAHLKLTFPQFQIIYKILEPKNETASNFYRYLIPSSYFDEPDIKKEIDEKNAIHFSNRPPSYARAFYRSCMFPFSPLLPQKLIMEITDLLCQIFPAFTYNVLNAWPNMTDYDKFMTMKYPETVLNSFKLVSIETIDIYRSAFNDLKFIMKKEITEELLKTALSADSNVVFAVNACDAIMKYNSSFSELLKKEEIVNSPNFLCFCVLCAHANKTFKNEELKNEIADKIDDTKRKSLFENLDTRESIESLFHLI